MQKISIKEENNMKVKNKIEKQSNNNVKNIITNYPVNNKSGITLIALIVTIIVLLIISGIVINSITGSNGILTNSKNAVNKYKKAQAEEAVGLLLQEYQMENANSNISFEDWLKKIRDEGEIEDYENQGDGTIAITKDGYIVFVDIDGTHIIEDRETEKVGGVQPEVTAKLYSTDGKEITDQSTVIENEYVTITVNNKKKLDSIDSIKVYNAGGKEITEKSDTPIGDNKADASFKLTAKGKYVIRVKGSKKGLQRSKVVTVDVENLPDAPVDNLQGTYKLYTINGTEVSNEKHAKEVLTLKLTNITAYDKVDTEYVKLVKKATTDGEEDKEISKILDNGNISILGDNSDKTGVSSYYITENGVYEATMAASKYGFQKTTTFDITVSNIELATPELTLTSTANDTDSATLTATVTNASSFDSLSITVAGTTTSGTSASKTVTSNGTYQASAVGTKDGFTSATTIKSVTVSNIGLPTSTNYTGCYADVNDDGTVDGVIFIDLAHGASGQWGDSNGTYSYSATSNLRNYKISTKVSSYSGKFGTKQVIAPNGTSGNARFYVMALTDYDSGTHTWSDVCSKTQTVGSITFRLPSKEEWSAFGGQFAVTSSNYSSTYGISGWYWSSTAGHSSGAWGAYFGNGCMTSNTIGHHNWVRLCATF